MQPLKPAAPGAIRRLSLAQEQLWFLDQLAPRETTYNILMVWRLSGPLRVDLLRRCLNLVVARHESLRVSIHSDDGTPYQVVTPAAEVPLPVTDLRALPAAEREQRVRTEIDAQRDEPFDLAAGPLCRFRLLLPDDGAYVFCQGFHHIITDRWSTAVINAELSAAYRSLCSGTEPVFEDMVLDYTEFAESQRERLRDDVLAAELAFWQRKLAGLPVLDLPADRPRQAGGSHRGETLIKAFPKDLRVIVKQLADDHAASMFMVLAAAYNLVLSRYTGREDIPTGVPMLGRLEPEMEAVVGMFVNMVVLRSDLSGDPSFGELIDRVADANLELYEHQEVSFNQVVEAVAPVRDPDRNPLFQVSLQLLGESNSGENLSFPGVAAEYVPQASLTSRFDIAITVVDNGTSLCAGVEYSDMFDRWRIAAMLGHLETVLRTAAADPGLRLSRIPIVAGAEAGELVRAGRGAAVRYVVDRSMNLVPVGVPGELLIGGEPGEPGDMARLIDDPFDLGRLVYRTGDLVRWTRDLTIEFLGRVDDRTATVLPGPAEDEAGEPGRDEPRTPTEESVAGIFARVLSLPRVGAQESFFNVGGNSLQAMRAVSRINKAFGVKISVRTLYGNPNVRAVSAAVDEQLHGQFGGVS
jgi:acyl carrier protein